MSFIISNTNTYTQDKKMNFVNYFANTLSHEFYFDLIIFNLITQLNLKYW